MYCVKCGVRLQDGIKECPLCHTPVWDPGLPPAEPRYPEGALPKVTRESRMPLALVLTVLSVLAVAAVSTVCFKLYGSLRWGGYVVFGVALGYAIIVLPLWFDRYSPLVAIPVDHACTALFVLYACRASGGHWFLSFAFPLIGISLMLVLGLYVLLRYIRHGRHVIFGGFIIALGGATMLVEFFEHITFGHPMFRWSLYSAGTCLLLGVFLLLIGLIRPLREAMERRFFL